MRGFFYMSKVFLILFVIIIVNVVFVQVASSVYVQCKSAGFFAHVLFFCTEQRSVNNEDLLSCHYVNLLQWLCPDKNSSQLKGRKRRTKTYILQPLRNGAILTKAKCSKA